MFSVYAKSKADVFNSSSLKGVFVKLRFRDGLVWTVGLILQIKLRFQIFFLRGVDEAGGILKIVHYLLSGC